MTFTSLSAHKLWISTSHHHAGTPAGAPQYTCANHAYALVISHRSSPCTSPYYYNFFVYVFHPSFILIHHSHPYRYSFFSVWSGEQHHDNSRHDSPTLTLWIITVWEPPVWDSQVWTLSASMSKQRGTRWCRN